MATHCKTFALAAAVVASLTGGVAARPAWAQSDQQGTVDHAMGTLRDLRTDKEFGDARHLLGQARAVLIAPRIFKAGFFVGGEGGQAVLLTHDGTGWSNPAFYTIASASFGLQIGAQESEMIMLVMSDRALQALMKDKFQFGANAGLAVATLGSSVGGDTTSNGGPDIVVWSSSSGVYAGISLNGTVVEPRPRDDAAYYGRPVTSVDIVIKRDVHSAAASALVRTLDAL